MWKRLVPLVLLLAADPVLAGTLYRCEGVDGVRNYTNKKIAGSQCVVVSHYSTQAAAPARKSPTPAPASKPAVASPATPSGKKHVEFRTAPAGGSVAAGASSGAARVTRGAVYKYQKDGVAHYTNVAPAKAAQAKLLFSYVETCYACGVLPGVDFSNVRLNTNAFASEIRQAASEFGVEEAIVRAVIHAESAYRPNALSNKGAQGLMQLIPDTASRFGVTDPFEPAQNIRGGVKYLSWLLKRYGDNLTLASAAYNAGEGAVDRHGGVPPYSETQRYVQRVAQLADRYRGALRAN